MYIVVNDGSLLFVYQKLVLKRILILILLAKEIFTTMQLDENI